MTATEQIAVSPIPVSIDNVDDWDEIARQIAEESGLPSTVTPEFVAGMIAGAVPLLFEADAARATQLLRGTFSDHVVAQRQRTAGCLSGERPVSAAVRLVGARMADDHPVLRVHLSIRVQPAAGDRTVNSQFWDLQVGAQVTVGQAQCPNCGAPVGSGELICAYCRTDLRKVVETPLVVSRLELY